MNAVASSNCDRCYRRKSKCDRTVPCGACQRSSSDCVYTDRTRDRTVKADVVDRLERRLEQTEQRNKALVTELSRLRSVSDAPDRDAQQSLATPSTAETGPDSGRRLRTNEVAAQVSFLSTTAAGDRQYLGSTSGLLFADLVRASVDIPRSRNPSPPHDVHDGGVSTPVNARQLEDATSRPSYKLAEKLIRAYLDHDYLAFPFLIEKEVYLSLDRVYGVMPGPASAFDALLIDMLLAISTANVSKFDWRQLPSAESHHARAMSGIQGILALGGIKALQAILLLCQYRTGSSIQDNSGSMWHLVGIASRICFELGLHKEASYPLVESSIDTDGESSEYIYQEARRRTFWSVVALDRVTSNILGRPFAIRDDDYDHDVPMKDYQGDSPTSDNPATAERPFVFHHIVRYRVLCGKIVTTLHRKRRPDMSSDEAFGVRNGLHEELEQWFNSVLDLGLPSTSSSTDGPQVSCFLSMTWYQLIRANALLMIWRPSPLLAGLPETDASLQHIFEAAKQSITQYAKLHKTRQLNYSWITLQSVFMAGLSYIFAVSNHYRAKRGHQTQHSRHLAQDPLPMEVVGDTRACSKVLVAVSERWNALRHCHDVFDRLSDAVLADAVKIQTSTFQPASDPAPYQHTQARISPPGQQPLPDHNQVPTNTWMPANNLIPEDMPMTANWGFSAYSPLQVDNEFLHCYNDLQDLYTFNHINDPVLELSQDWLHYLGSGNIDEAQRRMES